MNRFTYVEDDELIIEEEEKKALDINTVVSTAIKEKGGLESGHHGHKGRKGKRGGSAPSKGAGGFGVWSADRSATLASQMMNEKYPEFKDRVFAAVGTWDEYGDLGPAVFLKPDEIPTEITELAQWDFRGRYGDSKDLYRGYATDDVAKFGRIAINLGQEGTKAGVSFSDNFDAAKGFASDGPMGFVITANVSATKVLLSHHIIPGYQDYLAGENEYWVDALTPDEVSITDIM